MRMLNTITYSAPAELDSAISAAADAWDAANNTARIWDRDASVWTGDDEAKWLGWLDIIDTELADAQKYRDLTADIGSAGFTQVLLMGMGGSSLCPEVLALTFGRQQFQILDSTDPAQIKHVEETLDLDHTLFIVASKSGSTLEPNCFKQYFYDRLSERVGAERAGRQFVAITDPGSKMEQVARSGGFRHIFFGKPEIGGRFSALSAFGLTAAASMGLDPERILIPAKEMSDACRAGDARTNPGALLGLILGTCQRNAIDKLTIFASPEIHDLGAWLEQLIAESTGKQGVSIIPVDREPTQPPDAYGRDRLFAFVSVRGNDHFREMFDGVAAAGHPAVKIEMDSIDDLSQEFFRWEFATAVAGSVMQINPFNQPDVEAAKIEARKITDEYERSGSLPTEQAFYQENRISLFTSDAYIRSLRSSGGDSLKSYLDAHIARITPGDYFGLLAYVEMNQESERLLTQIRAAVLARTGAATCLGFGPRFLHSTGQGYKGGANNGVFLQITCENAFDLQVPEQKYTFGVVKAAQARGDFQVLLDRGRRALRVHLPADVGEGLTRLASLI